MNAADLFLQSWTTWEYKKFVGITGWSYGFFFENGSINYQYVKALSRTYPTAVAGNLSIIHYLSSIHSVSFNYTPYPIYLYINLIYLSSLFLLSGYTRSFYFEGTGSNVGLFHLEYTINWNCTLPTEIYLNQDIYYPKGFTVAIQPNNYAQWKQLQKNRIQIVHNQETGNKEPVLLTVTIEPVQ